MSRKKEPQLIGINRRRIAEVAQRLFHKHGIENTKMDDIALEANMSKSTLYVYFRSKEEIANYLSLEAMMYLYENINQILSDGQEDSYSVFMSVCHFLYSFKQKFPLSFQLVVEEICVDDMITKEKPYLSELYEVGEQLNQLIYSYFRNAIVHEDETELKSLIFSLWGSIYGVIVLADNKQQYIQKSMNKSREQFLQQSFSGLYSLLNTGARV